MAENYPKSKLKRKKSSVEKLHPEISPRDTAKRSRPPLFPGEGAAETDGSAVPAAAWWDREQLPAAESLWALALKSALPCPANRRWDPVPDLPRPSAARAAAPKLDEQRWCDLRGDVAPFPEPAPPSPPRAAPSPDPLGLGSPRQDLPVRTEPDTPGGQLPPRSGPGRGVTDSRASPQTEAEKEEEEVVRGAGGAAGGGGLQSCPMCLLLFPAGFTQMDCDSHLAQCLSEMNVDMTW